MSSLGVINRRQSCRKTAGLRCHTVLILTLLLLAATGAEALPNLLRLSNMGDAFGVIREQRLVDGKVPSPESPINDFVATLFLESGAYVRFDLGRVGAIAAIQLVAVDDAVGVEISSDGHSYREVGLEEEDRVGKMLVLVGWPALRDVRYVKLTLEAGRERGAVAEVLAFADLPVDLPADLTYQVPPTFAETAARLVVREQWISRALFVLGSVSILLLFVALNSSRKRQVLLCSLLVAVGFVGWLRLGTFLGGGRVLHAWDQMHYYLGAKYLREMRYTELYRCLAAWERQQGRGFLVDGVRVRDLDDNRTHPGSWTQTEAGRCRREVSATRWREFGSDADDLRRLFTLRRIHDTFKDHGYNATPFLSALLEPLVRWLPPRSGPLLLLAALDLAALGGAVWVLWWGFGPLVAAASALVIGFGDPWAYTWTGGSLGRHFWLLALCTGLALLSKQRWVSGSTLLSLAGLLRLFPLVLLAGPGIQAVRSLVSRRNLRPAVLITVSVVLTLLIGAVLPVMLFGPDIWSDFFANSLGHGRVPSMNFMGLGAIFSFGLSDSALGTPPAGESLVWRRLGWLAAFLMAFAWLAWAQRKHRGVWQSIPLAAPLLFCSIPLSSYDFMWLVVLVPFVISFRLSLVALLGFVVSSNLVQEVLPESRVTYLVFSLGVLGVLAIFSWQASRRVDSTRA